MKTKIKKIAHVTDIPTELNIKINFIMEYIPEIDRMLDVLLTKLSIIGRTF